MIRSDREPAARRLAIIGAAILTWRFLPARAKSEEHEAIDDQELASITAAVAAD